MDSEIIAERKYYLDGDESRKPAVVVRLRKPTQPDNDYAECQCEIVTDEGLKVRSSSGVDALHAIIACLSLIGTTLSFLNESDFDGKLRWDAWSEGNLGLPTIKDHWPTREIYQADLRRRLEQAERERNSENSK